MASGARRRRATLDKPGHATATMELRELEGALSCKFPCLPILPRDLSFTQATITVVILVITI